MKEINIMRMDMIEQSKSKESFNNLEKTNEVFTRLFRNNTAVGAAYDWKRRKLISPENPIPIQAGLYVGSSDSIGWESRIITQEMVGKRIAIFKAVETKTPEGVATPEQINFIKVVNDFGGIAYFNKPEKEPKNECNTKNTRRKGIKARDLESRK